MSRLTYAARNMLVLTPQVRVLISAGDIGGGPNFQTWKDGWVFADQPYANIEKRSHMALVVITDGGTWQAPNQHNTAKFPRLTVDVWASPTRDAAGTPVRPDADLLIEDVFDALDPYLHTVNPGVPGNADLSAALPYLGKPGQPRIWGTAEQIAQRTGVMVMSSERLGSIDFSDVRDGNGARMGRVSYGLHTA